MTEIRQAQHADGIIAPKPRGPGLISPVLENTKPVEVAAPTFKRGFVLPKFWGLVRLHWPHMVSGGMGVSAKTAARLQACFQHPAHLLRLKTQTVDFLVLPKEPRP